MGETLPAVTTRVMRWSMTDEVTSPKHSTISTPASYGVSLLKAMAERLFSWTCKHVEVSFRVAQANSDSIPPRRDSV